MESHETLTTLDKDDYDSPWKEALEQLFPEFMAFYFPAAHADIDWSKGYTFLDQELRQVVRDAELGKRYVDKLVQVARCNGGEDWVYIHIEVQGRRDEDFAKRMFTYHYRLFDRYERPLASLAVLADSRPGWRPTRYAYELFGSRIQLDFPTVKLLDYEPELESLLGQNNPFSIVTAAHLLTQRTKQDANARFDAKWRLTRLLYDRGWDKQHILNLLAVIDWMMNLPAELEQRLRYNVELLEEECNMRYVTSFERLARQEGMQQGMQQGRQEEARLLLTKLLTRRFGSLPSELADRVGQADSELLELWIENLLDASSLAEVFSGH